mmetsp:Transcript_9424/g.28341  ORF Transcript_9424/g.28341 Transcript_9424/m.28341 type:complete len:268 (+) Transcript_9424:1036-1839(+)
MRAVRPTRCTKADGSCGGSYCTTHPTSGMSKPLAATSVHSRHPAGRSVKSASTASRAACFMRPCRARSGRAAVSGSRASSAAYKSTHAHVRKYTMTLSFWCDRRKEISSPSFSVASTVTNWMSRLLGVFCPSDAAAAPDSNACCFGCETATLTRTGFRRPARASASTASVCVAENKPVRRWRGNRLMIWSSCAWKPMSSSRSASSRMSTSSLRVSRLVHRRMRSARRPGVPMRTCPAPALKAATSCAGSVPPTSKRLPTPGRVFRNG